MYLNYIQFVEYIFRGIFNRLFLWYHPEFIKSGWIRSEVFLCFYALGKVANLQ